MKSILRRQFMNRWLDQGLHPTQSNIHLLGDLLHMNLARIGLIISSKKQFSQVKTQAFTSLRSTFSELIVMSRAVSSYVYKVTFLLKDEQSHSASAKGQPRILPIPGAKRGCWGRISEQGDHTLLLFKYFHCFQIKTTSLHTQKPSVDFFSPLKLSSFLLVPYEV